MAIKDGVLLDTWDSRSLRSITDVWTPPAPQREAEIQQTRNEIAENGCGPRPGEVLPRIFTEEIRVRIAEQYRAGASMEQLAQGWGRSAASIKKIIVRLA